MILQVLPLVADAFLRLIACSMKLALSSISEIKLHQLAEQKKQTPPVCSLPSVPKTRDVAVSSFTTPKALYVLSAGQLCPDFTMNHSGVQIRCNQTAKL